MLLAQQSMLLRSRHPAYIDTPQLASRQRLLAGRGACIPFPVQNLKNLVYGYYCTIACCMHPLSIEYVLIHKKKKKVFLRKIRYTWSVRCQNRDSTKTKYISHHVHTTCHNLQRHTEHVIIPKPLPNSGKFLA